jgi:hypothetical protein
MLEVYIVDAGDAKTWLTLQILPILQQ